MQYETNGKTLPQLQEALDQKLTTPEEIICTLQIRADKPTCSAGKQRRTLEAIERLQLTGRVIATTPNKSAMSSNKKAKQATTKDPFLATKRLNDLDWWKKHVTAMGNEEKQQLLTHLLNSMGNQPVVIVINK